MKEKNPSITSSGQDQNQDGYSAEQQKAGETHEESQHTNDHQESYTDEYDNYSPWG